MNKADREATTTAKERVVIGEARRGDEKGVGEGLVGNEAGVDDDRQNVCVKDEVEDVDEGAIRGGSLGRNTAQ